MIDVRGVDQGPIRVFVYVCTVVAVLLFIFLKVVLTHKFHLSLYKTSLRVHDILANFEVWYLNVLDMPLLVLPSGQHILL